ncbi:helix-turn-helix domain-containing protein [Nonomuraea antri]|uniref:helix-turn-helix domain-containing protein n=1 Tax=Nonomuraea antri TaxID=2730852 RepID=UPI002E2A59E3|nr:XRE family transcriptional regulator [Nonomuraea antri]
MRKVRHHGGMEPRPAIDTDPRLVGDRLRRLRQARGVSLSELARRAGIGKATLSGVETGTRNPTLETLWAITAQLGVPIGAILDTPAEPKVVRGSAVEAELLESFEDEHVTYELYRLRVPPGITQTSPAHHEGVSEHITVFSGTLSAGPLDAPLTAGPGDHISWRSDVPHGYRAHGPDIVRATLLMRYPAKP